MLFRHKSLLKHVGVNFNHNRIKRCIVSISNTEKDLILCIIENFYLVRKW